jgi:hypothetical protein
VPKPEIAMPPPRPIGLKRRLLMIVVNGETLSVRDAAARAGVTYQAMYQRHFKPAKVSQ